MTTTPIRNGVCLDNQAYARHHPLGQTVEHEVSTEANMEWQFAECLFCGESISRFRYLGGEWFDKWGVLDLDPNG